MVYGKIFCNEVIKLLLQYKSVNEGRLELEFNEIIPELLQLIEVISPDISPNELQLVIEKVVIEFIDLDHTPFWMIYLFPSNITK